MNRVLCVYSVLFLLFEDSKSHICCGVLFLWRTRKIYQSGTVSPAVTWSMFIDQRLL